MKNLTFFLVTYFLCGRLISDPTETISAAPTALPEDDFPEVELFVPSVYPPSEHDVIPFPYSTVLALEELNEHADCGLPTENEMISSGKFGSTVKQNSTVTSRN